MKKLSLLFAATLFAGSVPAISFADTGTQWTIFTPQDDACMSAPLDGFPATTDPKSFADYLRNNGTSPDVENKVTDNGIFMGTEITFDFEGKKGVVIFFPNPSFCSVFKTLFDNDTTTPPPVNN